MSLSKLAAQVDATQNKLSKLADQVEALTAAQKEISEVVQNFSEQFLEQQRSNAIGGFQKKVGGA